MVTFIVVLVLIGFCFLVTFVIDKLAYFYTKCEDCHTLINNTYDKKCPKCGCPNPRFIIPKPVNIVSSPPKKKEKKKDKKLKYKDVLIIGYVIIGILLFFIFTILIIKEIKYRRQVNILNSYESAYQYK